MNSSIHFIQSTTPVYTVGRLEILYYMISDQKRLRWLLMDKKNLKNPTRYSVSLRVLLSHRIKIVVKQTTFHARATAP
jgi:hypothetical protein